MRRCEGYLLGHPTSCLNCGARPQAQSGGVREHWQPLERLFVSAVTFAEIRFGIELIADIEKRATAARWLQQRAAPHVREPRAARQRRDVGVALVGWQKRARRIIPFHRISSSATALHHS